MDILWIFCGKKLRYQHPLSKVLELCTRYSLSRRCYQQSIPKICTDFSHYRSQKIKLLWRVADFLAQIRAYNNNSSKYLYMYIETKLCTACREKKPTSDFPKDKRQSDGLAWSCKKCTSMAATLWAHKNRKRRIEAAGGACACGESESSKLVLTPLFHDDGEPVLDHLYRQWYGVSCRKCRRKAR